MYGICCIDLILFVKKRLALISSHNRTNFEGVVGVRRTTTTVHGTHLFNRKRSFRNAVWALVILRQVLIVLLFPSRPIPKCYADYHCFLPRVFSL